MPPHRLTEKNVRPALERCMGNVSAAAKALGIGRSSLYDYVARRPTLAAFLADLREARIDNAESSLDAAVLRGEAWAVRFLLGTIGRGRGYVRQKDTARPGVNVAVQANQQVLEQHIQVTAPVGALQDGTPPALAAPPLDPFELYRRLMFEERRLESGHTESTLAEGQPINGEMGGICQAGNGILAPDTADVPSLPEANGDGQERR